MGSLSQVTLALLLLWNVSVIKCAPTRTNTEPLHFTRNGGGLVLDISNTLPGQFPRNPNYWTSNKESGESSKQDEFILPTIYQLRRHWEHNAAQDSDSDGEYASSSATSGDEGGVGNDDSDNGDSFESLSNSRLSEENDSRNPDADEPNPNIRYNLRQIVYPDRKAAAAAEAQYGVPNAVADAVGSYKTAAKRSPMCLRKCMAQGLLHPAQCHSLC